jgi:hypothetical protein
MIAVRMIQASAHQVIHVIAMGHRFVTAGWAMLVRAARLRRALDGVAGVDRDRVLVDVIIVHRVQMPIVQVIDVAGMAHRRGSAVGTVFVSVVGMMLLGAGGHVSFPSLVCGRNQTDAAGPHGVSAERWT